jgi:signal transduction histidine kinase
MLSDNNEFLVEYKRLRSVFQHGPVTHSVTIVNAILSAVVLAHADGAKLLTGWVAAIATLSTVRWIGGQRFLRRGRSAGKACTPWTLFSIFGAVATGALWGLGATVLSPVSESNQLFFALVIGGMCAGAVTVNGAHLPTVLAFILPACLPLAASFAAQGPEWRVAAIMVVIFVAALAAIGQAAHRTFGDHIRLQLALDQRQRELVEANVRLTEEMTQRQTAEATLHQAQKMEAIGQLTGGIAHDFNNLLQVVIGNMDLIRRLGADNPRVVAYADAASRAAMRGAELTSSLLTFARRQTLSTEPVEINTLLREFEPLLLRTLGALVRFEIVLVPHLPPCIADPAHFQSAVLNLVINARDAMPEGGVLSVMTDVETLHPVDLVGNADASPGRFVKVSVRDTGQGMTPEVMLRVFEPFFTTKEAGKGTGLGLSQVYGFARQSGGHLGLISAPGEGTVATLWLPAGPSSPAASDLLEGPDRSPGGPV